MKRPRRFRNTPRRKMELEAERRLSRLVRSVGYCERCGKRTGLQAAHILPKGKYRALKFDPQNVICLCTACHLFWWHRNPIEAAEWFRTKYPARYQYLQEKKQTLEKVNIVETLAFLKKLTGAI